MNIITQCINDYLLNPQSFILADGACPLVLSGAVLLCWRFLRGAPAFNAPLSIFTTSGSFQPIIPALNQI